MKTAKKKTTKFTTFGALSGCLIILVGIVTNVDDIIKRCKSIYHNIVSSEPASPAIASNPPKQTGDAKGDHSINIPGNNSGSVTYIDKQIVVHPSSPEIKQRKLPSEIENKEIQNPIRNVASDVTNTKLSSSFELHFVDKEHKPISGLMFHDSQHGFSGETDKFGKASFSLPPGTLSTNDFFSLTITMPDGHILPIPKNIDPLPIQKIIIQ